MKNRHLLILLVLSGFAGLAYELLWIRLLSLSFGSTTLSYSTVLGVFFGGLALGAWLSGRYGHRIQRPARFYGVIEIATALVALLLFPVLTRLGGFFAMLDPGPGLGGALLRLAVATPILIIPTLLMGATLPVVVRAVIQDDQEIGRGTALIYGFNTFGACLGAYLVSFQLLPAFGVFQSMLITVGTSFLAGLAAILLAKDSPTQPETPSERPSAASAPNDASASTRKLHQVAAVLTFLGGFSAVAFQVVWVRLFGIFMGGTAYAIGSVLIAVLIGIAVGSLLVANPLKGTKNAGLWYVGLQLVILIWIPLLYLLFPWVGYNLGEITMSGGSMAGLHLQLLGVFLALMLPTTASGAALPVLMGIVERHAEQTGQRLGNLYAANTVGSILGSVLTGFWLLPENGSEATTLVALLAVAISGALGAIFLMSRQKRVVRLLTAGLSVAIFSFYQGYDAMGMTWPAGNESFSTYQKRVTASKKSVLLFSEAKTATVLVTGDHIMRSLRLNGLGQGGFSLYPPHHILESLLVAAVPIAHHPNAERALVVGLGAGTTVHAMLKFGVQDITVLELEPKVVEAVELITRDENPLKSPKVHLVVDDARHYLLRQAAQKAEGYDFITSMPAHPWVASPIFTREFFETAKANLKPGGVFASWFGLQIMDEPAISSLLRAFSQVFQDYLIYYVQETNSFYLVGSNQPIPINTERLAKLHEMPIMKAQPAFENEGAFFFPLRVLGMGDSQTPPLPAGVVNTDDSAFVELHAPLAQPMASVSPKLLPEPGIPMRLLETADKKAWLTDYLEIALGTPGGHLPYGHRTMRPTLVTTMLKHAEGVLSPEAIAYYKARVQTLTEKDPNKRLLALETLAQTPGPYQVPASFALPLLGYKLRDPRRLDLLAKLPIGEDVVRTLFEESRELGLAAAKRLSETDREKPLAALMHAAATDDGQYSPAQIQTWFEKAQKVLVRGLSPDLLDELYGLARRYRLPEQAKMLAHWRLNASNQLAQHMLNQGRAAGSKGDFKTAQERLMAALEAGPASKLVVSLLIRSIVETNDTASLEPVKKRLRFEGWTELAIAAAIQDAEASKAASKAIEAPEPEKPTAELPVDDGSAASVMR